MTNDSSNIKEILKGFLYPGASEQPAFIVYSPLITSRLEYVCRFIFNQGLLCHFKLCDNETEFLKSDLNKINYSENELPDSFHIVPCGLLSEVGVKEGIPNVKTTNNKLLFYPVKGGDCETDIFSAVFYFISRYEEWQKFVKDAHGRFEIRNSILYKLSSSKKPVVDVWLQEFKLKLGKKFPAVNWQNRTFKYISTIDVDNVYAFKAKSFLRTKLGAIKDFFRGELNLVAARTATYVFAKPDPFDAYDLQIQLSKETHHPLIYFFLYRNNTKFDRTIDPSHPLFIKLFQKLNANNICYGLHPSYFTSDDESQLKNEIDLFKKDTGKGAVLCTRNHYLRFNIKTTPLQLQNAGVKFDFTMGFVEEVGFRAGTSLPFYYYDFNTESQMEIMAVPFMAMDGAFYIYDNVNLNSAMDELISIAKQIKELNGLFITVFHDRSFSKYHYPGWKELYTKLQKNI